MGLVATRPKMASLMRAGAAVSLREPSFSPRDLVQLEFWVCADKGLWQESTRTTPALAHNDPVGAWDDQSGKGRHATQATAGSRPLLQTSTQNGLPSLKGDGVDDSLAMPSSGLVRPCQYTIALRESTGTTNRFCGGNANGITVFDRLNTTTLRIFSNNGVVSVTHVYFDGAVHIGRCTFDSPLVTHRLTLGGSGPNSGQATGTVTTNPDLMLLFTGNGGGNTFFNGHILEFCFFSRLLQPEENHRLERYLGKKWGIPAL